MTYECATTKDASAHTSCKLCDADIAYLLANTTWSEIGSSTNEIKFAQQQYGVITSFVPDSVFTYA